MKTSRKLIVALTMAAMVLTMLGTGVVSAAAPTVQATAFTDIAGNANETAIDWVAALGIVNGRPGGTFDPSAKITRQEFAKIVVNFIGQNGLATQLANSGVQFKDAAKVADWAVGYVNAAKALKIVNGYPDGGFHPTDNVNAQDALTMLIRAIGDDHRATLIGSYPAGYLSAAAVLGISSGFTGAAALPVSRGEVAKFVYNAGSAKRSTPVYGANSQVTGYTNLSAPDDTMFHSVTAAGAYEVNKGATVTAVSGSTIYITNAGLTLADKVTVLGATKLSDLVGKTVNYAVNGSGQVALVEVPKAAAVQTVSGTLNTSATTLTNSGYTAVAGGVYGNWYVQNTGGVKFILFKDGSLAQLASGTDFTGFSYNGAALQANPATAPTWTGTGVVTLNGSGLGTRVDVTNYDQPNAWVGTKPSAAWNSTSGATFAVHLNTGVSQNITFKTTTTVTWNGASMSPADAYAKIQSDVAAKIYPVLQIATDGSWNAMSVSVTDTQVTGTLSSVSYASTGTSVKIGDTTALITSTYGHAATAQATTVDQLFPAIGSNVLALTVNGSVQYIFGVGNALTDGDYIANVTGISTDSNGGYNVTFDNAGSSYTLALSAAPSAALSTGYVALTVYQGKVTTSSIAAISTKVPASGDTLSVSGLTVSAGNVSAVQFDNATTGDLYASGSKGLALNTAAGANNSTDFYSVKWAVYDSTGKYLGNSALAVGAQFTVLKDAASNYVLIKK